MSAFETALQAELDATAAAHLYRRRRVVEIVDPASPVHVRVDGRQCLNFCSNDYLGLSSHAELRKASQAAAARYGVGSGASHLVTGHGPEHQALEEELAAFVGRPRALCFSTGYMANIGIANALLARGDAVLQDRLNHASLLDAGLHSRARFVRYPHCDARAVEAKLAKLHGRRCVVMTDAVFSMDGNLAPLPQLAAACRARDAWLMVDDAHGFGVLGEHGRGSVNAAQLGMDEVPVYMATLGKAAGTFGAFVAGSAALIETLVQKSRTYIYTTALPAPLAAATRAALKLIERDDWRRERLGQSIARFRAGAQQLGLSLMNSATAIQPLVIGEEAKALAISEALLQLGFLVTAIRPPTVPAGTARLRMTLSAAHSESEVDGLLEAFDRLRPLLQ